MRETAWAGKEQVVQLLAASDLVVRHHPSHPPVLDGVSLSCAAGELVAVVGGNGSGKSTLARALAGLVALESGRLEGARGRPPRVGLVLQDPAAQLVAATVADEVALGPQAAGLDAARVAGIVDAAIAQARLDGIWHRDPAQLSGGQQQRVASAAIGACDVEVLVLDEPTALLDERAATRFAGLVRAGARERGVIWITQRADEVAACDRVIVLDAGMVVWSGTIDSYVADPAIAATWDLELPVGARVAHALRARGAWPAGAAIPPHEAGVRAMLAGGARTGGDDA